jgi:hypothetical protein
MDDHIHDQMPETQIIAKANHSTVYIKLESNTVCIMYLFNSLWPSETTNKIKSINTLQLISSSSYKFLSRILGAEIYLQSENLTICFTLYRKLHKYNLF